MEDGGWRMEDGGWRVLKQALVGVAIAGLFALVIGGQARLPVGGDPVSAHDPSVVSKPCALGWGNRSNVPALGMVGFRETGN